MDGSVFFIIFAALKSLAVIITVVCWGLIVYAILKKREYMNARPREILQHSSSVSLDNSALLTDIKAKKIGRDGWERIIHTVETSETKDFKVAIIEADALVDSVLKAYAYPGENMGERLKSIKKDDLPSLDKLWNVHKLRNTIAHHPGYKVSVAQGYDTLKTYKTILSELGAI
jgi:hypothetical protein